LRRAQERMVQARPYAVSLASVLASLRRRIDLVDPATNVGRSPLLAVRPEKKVLLLVVSGDKGFAGAFSSNIVRTASTFITETREDRGKRVDVEAIGRKGRDFFRRRFRAAEWAETPKLSEQELSDQVHTGGPVEGTARPERHRHDDVEFWGTEAASRIVLDKVKFDDARQVSEEIVASYESGEIDAVYLAYNSFQTVLSQRVVVERILPLQTLKEGEKQGEMAAPEVKTSVELSDDERQKIAEAAMSAGLTLRDDELDAVRAQYEDESKRFGTANVDYQYDESASAVYAALLPRYVSALVYYSMLESVASEHAARMTAMDAASSNASDMIDALTLTMNRVRQAAITKEIIEIVSGAAAV
jgi:F-type H+-transporting ATPase subunit gamma